MRVLVPLSLLLLAGLGTIAYHALAADDMGAPATMVETAAVAAAPETASPTIEASGDRTAEPQAAVAGSPSPDTDTDDESPTLERLGALPDDRQAPRVRVVRGSPPQPVPAVEVLFVTEPEAMQRLGARASGLPRYEWPEQVGRSARTDAEGLAVLPRAEQPWLCAARTANEFAFEQVASRPGTVDLVLLPDETVAVQTVFGPDQPAPGIPVALLQQTTREPAGTVAGGTTGSDGWLRIRHFQLLRQANRDGPDSFAAMPLVPAASAVAFAGRPTDGTPLVLTLPPLGSISVQLVDHRGTPLLSPAAIGLAGDAAMQPAPNQPLALPGGLLHQRREKPVGSEPVLLPFHAIGVPLQIYARLPHDRRSASVGPLLGPTQPGELVNVALPLTKEQAVLAGAFTLPDGSPIGDAVVRGVLWRSDRDGPQLNLHTIAGGRFDAVLAQRTDASEFWLELRHELAASEGQAAERIGARIHVPAIRGGIRLELGTVALGPLPTLVRGQVVDDEGQPVADADVQVQQQDPPQQGQDPKDAWHPLPLFRTRSAADGTFAIEGQKPPGVLRVRADTDRHFADSLPLHSAGQVVRIQIARNGILRGRVLLPDWLPDGALSLQMRPTDEALRAKETRAVDLQRRGRFTIEPLRPGRYDALIAMRNSKAPLLVLNDVFVPPGETRDARLRPLDLRNALHRFRLRAVDAGGAPLAHDGPLLVKQQRTDGSTEQNAFRFVRGACELITDSSLIDVVAFGRGIRTTRLVLTAGDHDVRLVGLRPALIEMSGLRALCGPQRKVRISAILQGDTGLPAQLGGQDQRSGERFEFSRWDLGRSSGGWLGNSDTIEIPILTSGKYELLFRPHATDSERSPQGQLSLGTFELQADAFAPVRVKYDAVRLARTLQQLDERHAQAQAGGAAPRPR